MADVSLQTKAVQTASNTYDAAKANLLTAQAAQQSALAAYQQAQTDLLNALKALRTAVGQ